MRREPRTCGRRYLATMPRVVIVGAGFGGLNCARALAGKPVDVLLIDRQNYHLFTPLVYQVASSLLNPSDIAFPVRTVLRGARNVGVRLAEVTGVDFDHRLVRTVDGPDEPYDYLVLATGARINFFGQSAIEASAFNLSDLPSALQLRNHVLSRFEAAVTADLPAKRRALTFVVVGGGPTGVEYAGALAELVRLVVLRDYPGIVRADVRILVVEGADRVLPAFPPQLGAHARSRLERLGATVRTGVLVRSVNKSRIELSSGETVDADTLVWAAGVMPNALAAALPTGRRKNGRVEVDEYLRLRGQERVFAIGDMAAVLHGDGDLPMLAQPAIQEGRAAGRNILRHLAGRPLRPFRYFDPGIMATIGRNAGVAQIRRLALKGWLGWVAWLAVHLYFLIGFRNRLAVLLQWAWNYIFYDRPIRFIVHEARRGLPYNRRED
jgi:NADH:ubiquinone reductase (H+-translocating)